MDEERFTHLDARGRARMVDVSAKEATRRRARAEGVVRLRSETVRALVEGTIGKGDVAAVARVAGIQAAKRTAEWIPLCHPLRLDAVHVHVEPEPDAGRVRIEAEVVAFDRTGVEMEALTAVAAAALTVYDMTKAVDRGAVLDGIRLLEKEGGRSGTWRRESGEAPS